MPRMKDSDKAIRKEWLQRVCYFMIRYDVHDMGLAEAVKTDDDERVCQHLQALTSVVQQGAKNSRSSRSRSFAARNLLKQYQAMKEKMRPEYRELVALRRRLTGVSIA